MQKEALKLVQVVTDAKRQLADSIEEMIETLTRRSQEFIVQDKPELGRTRTNH